jgi:hypothetical protein
MIFHLIIYFHTSSAEFPAVFDARPLGYPGLVSAEMSSTGADFGASAKVDG